MTRRRHVPGITTYPRGKTWAYQVTGEPDPLTDKPDRHYKGGFATEDDAFNAALDLRQRIERGMKAREKKIRVRAYFDEWLTSVKPSLKKTTFSTYEDNFNAYIDPVLGGRWLTDLSVPRLNAFYRHLSERGRRKPDKNTKMYAYWSERQTERSGLGPLPSEIAEACGTTIHAARAAATRFRRGRVPQQTTPGLAPKSVKNVHRLMHRALKDAVAWGYLFTNPTEHVVKPRDPRRKRVVETSPWTVEELGRWLKVALDDRFDGIWALVATTGMRRSELAGISRQNLDLDNEFLAVEGTRVTVGGQVADSDGKSDAGVRGISLDAFTVKHLKRYLERIDTEKEAFGKDYPDHGRLVVWPDGTQIYPGTITRTFNRLVDKAGVPRIRLHDVRHTYATLAMDAGADAKLLADRLGHDVTTMLKVYTHRTQGRDREIARKMAGLSEAAINPATAPEKEAPATESATDHPK